MPTNNQYTEQEIIDDVKQAAEQVDGNLSINEYMDKGEISQHTVVRRFGSWNKAKKAAGVQVNTSSRSSGVDIERGLKHVREVAEEVEPPLTMKKYRDSYDSLKGLCIHTLKHRLGVETWQEVKEEAGVDDKDDYYRAPEAFQKWHDWLKGRHGRFYISDLREEFEKLTPDHSFNKRVWPVFTKWLEEEGDIQFTTKNASGVNGQAIFVKGDLQARYGDYLEQIPNDRVEDFMDAVNRGKSPKVTCAAIRYQEEDDGTQKQLAAELGVTTTSVRNVRDYLQSKTTEEQDTEGEKLE